MPKSRRLILSTGKVLGFSLWTFTKFMMSASSSLTVVSTPLQLFTRELCKPALYLIDPRCGCWCEVHMVMWVPRQPGLDFLCFVSGVVIHDNVDIKVVCHAQIDLLQESQKLPRPMTLVALTDDETCGDIERRKQRRGAMADVIMGLAFRDARHHG